MRAVSSVDEKTVAALNDTVEDTDVALADLEQVGFSPEVVAAVDALTRRSDEPYVDFIARVRANPLAAAGELSVIRSWPFPTSSFFTFSPPS